MRKSRSTCMFFVVFDVSFCGLFVVVLWLFCGLFVVSVWFVCDQFAFVGCDALVMPMQFLWSFCGLSFEFLWSKWPSRDASHCNHKTF